MHNASTGATFEQRVGGTLKGSLTTDTQVTLKSVTSIPLVFSTANTERLRIDSSGNVGIGESNPATKLHLKLDTDKHIRFQGNIGEIGGVPGFQGVTDAGALVGLGMRGSDLRFATGSNERMRIDSSGNVGIGTTSADANLHIKGGYPTVHIERDSAINYSRLLLDNTANDGGAIDGIGDGTGGLRFSTSDAGTITERLRIDSSGRLLVGTSSSSSNNSVVIEGYSGSGTGQGIVTLARGSSTPCRRKCFRCS